MALCKTNSFTSKIKYTEKSPKEDVPRFNPLYYEEKYKLKIFKQKKSPNKLRDFVGPEGFEPPTLWV